jgi:hypothetical protein
VRQAWVTEEKFPLSGDKKARESEQEECRRPRKSMHQLETRQQGKVSRMSTGDIGQARTN